MVEVDGSGPELHRVDDPGAGVVVGVGVGAAARCSRRSTGRRPSTADQPAPTLPMRPHAPAGQNAVMPRANRRHDDRRPLARRWVLATTSPSGTRARCWTVRRVSGARADPHLPLPGLPAGDRRGDPARRRLAGRRGGWARGPAALAYRLLEPSGRPSRRQRVPLTRLGSLPTMSRDPDEIRASSILPGAAQRRRPPHRRRPPAGRRAVAAGGPGPGGHPRHPPPATDPRRVHGQPRVQEGRLPPAGAGRPRGAPLQPARRHLSARGRPRALRQRG